MGKTPIEWATHTENWLAGCTKVSPACTHCYAETMTARLATMLHAPDRYRDGVIKDRRWTGQISYSIAPMLVMFQGLATATKPRRVFCNSMSDTFHANVPAESLTDLADQIETWDRCWWRAGRITAEDYRARFEKRVTAAVEGIKPNAMWFERNNGRGYGSVEDGDTLCCACSRDEAAAGRCHRAWAAPLLVAAGWRVVLDGEEVALG